MEGFCFCGVGEKGGWMGREMQMGGIA